MISHDGIMRNLREIKEVHDRFLDVFFLKKSCPSIQPVVNPWGNIHHTAELWICDKACESVSHCQACTLYSHRTYRVEYFTIHILFREFKAFQSIRLLGERKTSNRNQTPQQALRWVLASGKSWKHVRASNNTSDYGRNWGDLPFLINESILAKTSRFCSSCGNPRIVHRTSLSWAPQLLGTYITET